VSQVSFQEPSGTRPRRSRRWVIGLTIGIVVAVLAVCALPVTGFFVWLYGGPDIKDVRVAAGHYFERIEAGDDAGGYALVCERARHDMTAAAFTELLDKGPRPASHTVSGGAFLDEAGKRASVDVHVVDRTGAARLVDLDLEQHQDSWQVCGKTYV
jgi:hypothetical protein